VWQRFDLTIERGSTSALCTHMFCICGFNKLWTENIWGKNHICTKHGHIFFLSSFPKQYRTTIVYIAFYIVLGINNLETTFSVLGMEPSASHVRQAPIPRNYTPDP
jgi:hypothetical protein